MALSGSVTTTGGYDGRNLTLSWTATQNIDTNKSTVSWTLSNSGGDASWYAMRHLIVTIDGTTVYTRDARYEQYSGTIATGSITLEHDSNGQKSFTVTIQAAVYNSAVNARANKTFTLDRIYRTSTLSSGNFTMGTAGTITVTRANNTYTHTVTYSFGSQTGTVVTKSSSTSISFTPSTSLASQVPNATSGILTLTCETFNGNTSLGTTSITKTLSVPDSIKPTVSSATYANTNNSLGVYAATLSAIKMTAISATAGTGATIQSYSTTFNGQTYNGTSFTTAIPATSGSYNLVITVTDSRGRTGTKTYTIAYAAYSAPTLSFTAVRTDASGNADDTGAYMKFTMTGTACSVKSGSTEKNSATGKIEYRKVGGSTWTTLNATASGLNATYSGVVAAAASDAYEVIASVTDKAGTTTVKNVTVSSASYPMTFYRGGKGVAFGRVANKNGFVCEMDAEFNGGFKANGVKLLGGTTTIANGTNLNTLTTLGEYVVYDAGSKTCTNTPWGTAASNNAQAFRLTVERSLRSGDSVYLRQTLFPYNNANGYKRWSTNSGSTWTGWNLIQADLGSKANLASPTFTGTPKAPTAASGSNTTQIATTAFVQAALFQNVLTTTALEASTSSITSAQSSSSNRVGDFKGGFIRIGDLVFVSFYCKALMNLAETGDYWTIARGFPKAWATTALSASFYKTRGAMNGYINTDGELLITLDSYSVATGEYICVSGFYIAEPVTT